MSEQVLRIATRRSPLAIWQAEYVKDRLEEFHPGITVELVRMQTRGDKILDTPLAKVGGKGLFVKELEVALLEGEADLAVHSMKDVPVEFPEGLGLHIICPREDPRDAFVSNNFKRLQDLPQGARVGTCSLRRQCQLSSFRPDLELVELRGNVNTRLAKLDSGEFDAIILACAGLKRLEMADRIAEEIPPEFSLPAVGQGAVGIECRTADTKTRELLAPLNDADSWTVVAAERAMNNRLQGGCQVPIAGFAELKGGELFMRGLVGSPDGKKVFKAQAQAPRSDAEKLGVQIAEELLEQGAGEVLAALYNN